VSTLAALSLDISANNSNLKILKTPNHQTASVDTLDKMSTVSTLAALRLDVSTNKMSCFVAE
jgi:hypothetical protein